MDSPNTKKGDAKKIFRQCGACSHTFAHILNREFGHPKELEELALNPLAGGILNQGHQCGMIWGAALAVGAESYRKHKDKDLAVAVAVTATRHLVKSFEKRSNTVNCKEILGYSLSNVLGLVRLMLHATLKGMDNSNCFNLAEDWAPEAIQSGTEGLNQEQIAITEKPISCASEVVRRMGGTDEEILMVAGFAGGLGLNGNACGALSAAIWMKTLIWCREHPGKIPPYFNNKISEKVLKVFNEATESDILCHTIAGQRFTTINEHSKYINSGGCQELIDALVKA